jgi:hypothetical protein
VLFLVLTGCGDDGGGTGGGGTGGGTGDSGSSSAELDAALAELRDAYAATPAGIASDLSAFGVTTVTPEEVLGFAHDLCASAFDPTVAVAWLEAQHVALSWMVFGPAQRLAQYAGTPAVCTRPATEDEAAAYAQGITAPLPDLLPHLPTQQPTNSERVLCAVLGSDAGGAAVEAALEAILGAASRNRIQGGDALALGVEVAGAACPDLLPVARDALTEFLGGSGG